jgi:hypothetical protein
MGGFGGALKNMSIGIASTAGKTHIHTAGKTSDHKIIWKNTAKQDDFLESMADACRGVVDYMGAENILYINIANRLSVDCDCDSHPAEPEMGDLGIFASLDPVALDCACYDAVKNSPDAGKAALIERMDSRHGIHTVEAGEKLGFLPGDLQNKVDPYLRPLYDALQEMFGLETYQKLLEKGAIEIAPLAYMRGRTLSNAFIILDEAQNTTKEQMKMFLTRMGESSKMVITGDVTQIDLPEGKRSGLIHAVSILKNIEGVETVTLTHKDVVRHALVMEIIKAYDKAAKADEQRRSR